MADNSNGNPINGGNPPPDRNSSGSPSVDNILRNLASISGNMEASTKEFRALVQQYKKMSSSTGSSGRKSSYNFENDYKGIFDIKTLRDIKNKELQNRSDLQKITAGFTESWKSQLKDLQEKSKALKDSPLVGVFKNLEGRMKDAEKSYITSTKSFIDSYDKEMKDVVDRVSKTKDSFDKVSSKSQEISNRFSRCVGYIELNEIDIEKHTKDIERLRREERRLRQQGNVSEADDLKQQRSEHVQERKQLKNTNKELIQQKDLIEKQKEVVEKSLNSLGDELDKASKSMKARSEEVDKRLGTSENISKTTVDFERTLENLNNTAKLTEEANSAHSRAENYIPKSGFAQRAESYRKEKEEQDTAFEDADDALTKLINQLNNTIEQQKKISEKQNESASALRQAASDLTESARNHKEAAQIAKDSGDIIKAQQEEHLAEQDKQNAKIKENNAKEAENLAKEADNNVETLTNQKDNAERSKESLANANSTFSKITTTIKNSIGDGLVNGVKKIAGTYYEAQLAAFQNVYNAIETTQNSIAKKLKLDSGAYDKFTDTVDAEISKQGLDSVISSTDALEEIQTFADMGIRDDNLISVLGVQAAKSKALGADLDLTNEETVKYLQKTYQSVVDEGGSEDEAKKAVEDLTNYMMGSNLEVGEKYKSTSALVNGGSSEIINTLLPYMQASGVSIEDQGKAYAQAANVEQAMESEGIDASLIMEDLKAVMNGKSYDSMSTTTLAAIEQFGLTRGDIEDRLKSGDLAGVLSEFLQNRVDIYSGTDANSIGWKQNAYGDEASIVDAELLKNASESGALDKKTSEISMDDINSQYSDAMKNAKEGSYYSKTYTTTKGMENAAYTLAEGAQDIVFGDQQTLAAINGIKDTVSSILTVLITQGAGSLLKGVGSLFGSAGAAGAGAAGAGAAGAAGAGAGAAGAGGLGSAALAAAAPAALIAEIAAVGVGINGFGNSLAEGNDMSDAIVDGFKAVPIIGDIADWSYENSDKIVDGIATGFKVITNPIGSMVDSWKETARQAHFDEVTTSAEELTKAAQDIRDAATEAFNKMTDSVTNSVDKFNNGNSSYDQTKAILDAQNAVNESGYLSEDQKKGLTDHTEEELIKMPTEEKSQILNKIQTTSSNAGKTALANANKSADFLTNNADALAGLSESVNYTDKDMKAWAKKKNKAFDGNTQKDWEAIYKDEKKQQLLEGTNALLDDAIKEMDIDAVDMSEWGGQQFLDYLGLTNEALKESGLGKKEINALISAASERTSAFTEEKKSYDEKNAEFQAKVKELGLSDISSNNQQALISAYEEKYGVVPTFTYSDLDLNTPILPTAEGTLHPYILGDDIKFATGTDYIPIDNYPALLHEGEMVLNKPEATHYRTENSVSNMELMELNKELTDIVSDSENSMFNSTEMMQSTINNNGISGTSYTFDSSPITNSIGSQTDRIENLLNKIIMILSSSSSKSLNSRGFNSVLNMDSNVARLNAIG